jgi:iron complex outermembrane receptor protein
VGDAPTRINVTYYHSDYSNIQRPQGDYNPVTGASGAQILAATARIRGIEIEGSIRPATGLELGGTFSHTDADYRDFNAAVFSPTQACNGLRQFGQVADFSCYPFQFVTPKMYTIYGSYDVALRGLGDLSLYMSWSHVSSQNVMPSGDGSTEPGAELEPYGLLNASIALRNVGGTGVDLIVFGNNLTNKLYRTMNSNSFNNLLASTTLYGEPRTYGLKAKFSF